MDITALMESHGYLGLVLIVALENLFPPIPSEVVLPFAGFMAARGILQFIGVIVASTLGSVLGALVLYGLGYYLGRGWAFAFVERYGRYVKITRKDLGRADEWFDRYGPWTVFFCRMVPIIRSIISVPAGAARMSLASFVGFTALGTAIWNVLLVSGGMALETAWPEVEKWVSHYKYIFLGVMAVILTVLLVRYYLKPKER